MVVQYDMKGSEIVQKSPKIILNLLEFIFIVFCIKKMLQKKHFLCKIQQTLQFEFETIYFEYAVILMNVMLRGSILYSCQIYYNLKENVAPN